MTDEIDSDSDATPQEAEHNQQQTTPKQKTKKRSKFDEKFAVKYLAKSVISLFVPVSLCMVLVILATTTNVNFIAVQDALSVQTIFRETGDDSLADLWSAIIYSLIIIGATVVVTVVFITLYIYKFYKVIIGWLMFTTFTVISFFTFNLLRNILLSYNIPVDIFTVILFHWNFGVPAMICIFWKGPLRIQQAYLIYIAARLAIAFMEFLPGWTTWTFLFGISIWDIIAVLAPRGPLKIFIETAEKRNEAVSPALIYTTIAYGAITSTDEDRIDTEPDEDSSQSSVDSSSSHESDQDESSQGSDDIESTTSKSPSTASAKAKSRHRKKRPNPKRNQEGIKLGLGDFIMYSVLIGKVSTYGDWNTIYACFISVLTGLGITFLLLLASKKALPGLPISIALGLIAYFLTAGMVQPLAERLLIEQIFI